MYMQQRPPGMAAGQFAAHQGPRPGFLPHPGGPGAYGAPHGLPMRPMMPGMRPGMPSGGYGPPHGGMQQRPPMMAPPGYGPPQPGPPGMQQYPGMYGGPPAQYGSGGHPGGGPATNMCGDGLGAREGCAARVRSCAARGRPFFYCHGVRLHRWRQGMQQQERCDGTGAESLAIALETR